MANRFPLIFNSGAGQIQELAASDNLDLTSSNLVNAGILFTSSGSATAPSLQIGSGTTYNPGLYSPDADQLAISTSGVGRLFVDASGNIDIAGNATVSNASAVLKVNGTSGSPQLLFQRAGANSSQLTDVGASGLLLQTIAGNPLLFGTNASERLRITSAGLVGIGTSNPGTGTLLDVAGTLGITTGAADGIIRRTTVNGSNGIRIQGNTNDTISDTNPGSSIVLAGGSLTDGFEGNVIITAYGTTGSVDRNTIRFQTRSGVNSLTERMRISSGGNVGIDTTSPGYKLTTNGSIGLGVASNGTTQLVFDGSIGGDVIGASAAVQGTYTNFGSNSNGALLFLTNSSSALSEKARIDSSGRLLVGTSTATGNTLTSSQKFVVAGSGDNTYPGLSVIGHTGTSFASAAPIVSIHRSRGTSDGSYTEVANGDALGYLIWAGADGAAWSEAASIKAEADGDWTTSGDTTDSPGRLVFSTTPDGAASPLPQATITNGGLFYIGTTDGINPSVGNTGFLKVYGRSDRSSFYAQAYSQTVSYFNRTTNDGTLLEFLQDGTTEGNISVSGTTVSYNGAHLSRWSQLPSGAERTEILRGSVLSNIDEMCEWTDEENEQLNRMKVSDVEGDKNVSGVFQCWDDDDDTYTDDFYCAMTGDFIIRIAEGVTVERGDLLMSAGDGTAKPQDDDIIRSKTIAKVTSTSVSCTYEDGSYCVPCVLMAC